MSGSGLEEGRWQDGGAATSARDEASAFRDAVKQQLAWEYGDSDSPSKLMAVMDAQLDKFEAAEAILGVRARDAVSEKPKDKTQCNDGGRVKKNAVGKKNGSQSRGSGGGERTFWGAYYACGEQGHTKAQCPTRKGRDKKAAGQQQTSSSVTTPSSSASVGTRPRAPASASSSVAQGPASRTRSAVSGKPTVSHRAVLVGSQDKGNGHADSVQDRLGVCLEQIQMLRMELVGTEVHDSPADDGMSKACARRMGCVTTPNGEDSGVGSEALPGGSLGGAGVDMEPLQYHCGADLVVPGGVTLAPLGLKAVLDSASGVTGMSESLLGQLREHFGGVEVSPLPSGECQVLVADGRAIQARYQTQEMQVTLQAGHCRLSFMVAFVVLPGSTTC